MKMHEQPSRLPRHHPHSTPHPAARCPAAPAWRPGACCRSAAACSAETGCRPHPAVAADRTEECSRVPKTTPVPGGGLAIPHLLHLSPPYLTCSCSWAACCSRSRAARLSSSACISAAALSAAAQREQGRRSIQPTAACICVEKLAHSLTSELCPVSQFISPASLPTTPTGDACGCSTGFRLMCCRLALQLLLRLARFALAGGQLALQSRHLGVGGRDDAASSA